MSEKLAGAEIFGALRSAADAIVRDAELHLSQSPEQKAANKESVEFAGLSSAQHLKAAKDALADGYDAKNRIGGQLDEAERHLNAIETSAKESRVAKALAEESSNRRARLAQSAKVAEIVKEVSEDAKYEFSGGRLVVTTEGTAPGALRDGTISGHGTLRGIVEQGAFDDLPDLQVLTVVEFVTYEDTRGNEKRIKGGEFTVSRKTAATINWSNIRTENVLKVIDKAWIVPGTHYLSD